MAERPARDPFRSLMALMHRGDVTQYRKGAEPAFLVSNPEYIKHVLADNASNYSKETYINGQFKQAVADGLLVTEGDYWRRQRRLMSPAFHRSKLAALGEEMTAAAVRMLEGRWADATPGGAELDVAVEMSTLTLGITARALFGFDITREAGQLGAHIARAVKVIVAPDKPEVHEAKRFVEQLIDGFVADRRAGGEPGTPDLLAMLLAARDPDTGEAMTDRQLRDEILTLLVAGYETTSNTLTWTWSLLSANPEPRARLHEELDARLGGRPPTVEDLPSLPYLKMTLEESLRLYPPAWILGRKALGDDRLGEHEIQAGSVLALCPYTMHRHPAYWDEPDRFEPERFAPDRVTDLHPFLYFPFGGGPRYCIGHNFATLEAQLIIATIASRFELELLPDFVLEPERLFVLRPRGGHLPMRVTPRVPA